MATTEQRVEHILYAESLGVPEMIKGERLCINGAWTGTFAGKEMSSGKGHMFAYFRNEAEQYRITVIVDTDDNFYNFSVNATDGSHETHVMMDKITSVSIV
jgi:hypothetical protein